MCENWWYPDTPFDSKVTLCPSVTPCLTLTRVTLTRQSAILASGWWIAQLEDIPVFRENRLWVSWPGTRQGRACLHALLTESPEKYIQKETSSRVQDVVGGGKNEWNIMDEWMMDMWMDGWWMNECMNMNVCTNMRMNEYEWIWMNE